MSRLELISECRNLLGAFVGRLSVGNPANLLDENTISETFFQELLNTLEDASFVNLNAEKMNHPGIDLADSKRKECVQITSETTPAKIRETLDSFFNPERDLSGKYDKIRFLYLTWETPPDGRKSRHPREKEVEKVFEGVGGIMKKIMACDMAKLVRVTDLLRDNLGTAVASKMVLELGEIYLSGAVDGDGIGRLRVPYTLTATGSGNVKDGEVVVATSVLVNGEPVKTESINIIPRNAWNPCGRRYKHMRAFENIGVVRTSIPEAGELEFCFAVPKITPDTEIRVNALVAGWGSPMEASSVTDLKKILAAKNS